MRCFALILVVLLGFGCGNDDPTSPKDERPIQPSNVVATKTEKGVMLSWTDMSDNEEAFTVWRGNPETGKWRQLYAVRPNETGMLDDLYPLTYFPETIANGEVNYMIEAITAFDQLDLFADPRERASQPSNFIPVLP